MATHPDVLQHCLQEAASASRAALERCIEQAIASVQLAETQSMKVAERDALSSAWRQLQDHKPAWLARYPADLQTAFSAAVATASQNPAATEAPLSPSAWSPAGTDSFSLVDDADVAQAIESSRLLQLVLPRVEQPLAELDALISSVQGLANVRPELNPLRPGVFAQVLQAMLAAAALDATMLATWSRHLAKPLGMELQRIYEKIITLLELAHVPAAQYRVLQTPANATGRYRHPGNGGGHSSAVGTDAAWQAGPEGEQFGAPPAPPQYADLSNYEIRDELFQNFLFHGGSNAHHGLAPSYYDNVVEELAALKAAPESAAAPLTDTAHIRQQDLPVVDRPPRFVGVSSQLSPQVWGTYGRSRERAMVRTQLKNEAVQVGQVLGLEVVRKLVSQVAQDPRLLVPVREAIVALEPSLLRLAMVDPRFFSDEGHPGRRLMERVAQRSFKYNDEYSPEFASFFQPVTQAVNDLNALAIEDDKPFSMALATLEYAWDEQDQQALQKRRNVVQALRFAEDRQERADQIAFELSARSDLDKVPGVVLDFLFGPWSLAMAHARLVDERNQIDPEGFGSVVPDLLWSVKRDVTLKRPDKLIDMIPGLLEKLHSGLAMLGQDPKENEQFFESLMMLHQPVLKLRRLKTRRDAQESSAMRLEAEAEVLPATPEQRQAKAAEQPWLGRGELDAAGFEDTQPTAPGELPNMAHFLEQDCAISPPVIVQPVDGPGLEPVPEATADVAADTVPATAPQGYAKAEAEAMLSSLRTGDWVDLHSKRRWLRAQLVWASTKGTLFMFLSHGGQPHSMTRRSCEKLIMQRWLRPVDTHGVVAQALHVMAVEVAQTLATGKPAPQTAQDLENEPETA